MSNRCNDTIAIDFDAVISRYSGWKGKGIFGEPVSGAKAALNWLMNAGYKVIINTTRSETWLVEEYMLSNGLPFDHINFNPDNVTLHLSPSKVIADIYVDDRALKFEGNWRKTLQDIVTFKVWWGR